MSYLKGYWETFSETVDFLAAFYLTYRVYNDDNLAFLLVSVAMFFGLFGIVRVAIEKKVS